MKMNKMFFVTAFSLVAFQAMSPTEFIAAHKSIANRMPAAEAKKAPAKKPVAKKAVTSKEMKALEAKLSLLEKDMKNKEIQLEEKSKEIEILKNSKTEEKIDALTKLIAEQKSDIEKLRTDIKNSEVKEVRIQNHNAVEVVICKSESKGEKLEADVKKLLEDKESVLKEVAGLKKENEDLKVKLTVAPEAKPILVAEVKPEAKPEAKPEVKAEVAKAEEKAEVKIEEKKPEAKKQEIAQKDEPRKSDNSDLIALMTQMTSMFTAQMQSQMQMQMQMMSLFTQMQSNNAPQMSPYSYAPSYFSHGQGLAYPTLSDSLDFSSRGLGIRAPASWEQNPYSIMPNMSRQNLSQPSDFGFSFNRPQGFDFNQAPATFQQPVLPSPVRQQIPFSATTISV